MSKVVHFSRETFIDSIGAEGFVTTRGVAILPAVNEAGASCVLLHPVGEHGETVGDCRVVLDIDAMADIVMELVGLMAEEMARRRVAAAPPSRVYGYAVEVLRPLSVGELESRFGPSGEAPDYPRSDWMHEVRNGDTGSGYWEWVSDQAYNETFERTMNVDHAAEKLLVDRAAAAAEQLDTYPWKTEGGIADSGSWVTMAFEDRHELRTCVKLEDGGYLAFYVEFAPTRAKVIGVGTYPFDPRLESLD